jgi:iron complex outermembrane receptor protein
MSVNDNTRINGSAYYYDYRDYQTFLFVDVGGNVINRDAENKGIELEIQTTPRDGLDILANISYLDAEVKDLPLRVGSPLAPRDVKPTYTPELQATAMVRYAWPALGGTMSMQGDVSYSDEFYYNARNFDADKFSSYVMANARLSWMSDDGKLSGAFAIRNLTDERAGIQGFDIAILCGCNEVSYRAPRYYSLSLKREF